MKNVTLSGGMPRRNGVGRFLMRKPNTIIDIVAALFILLFAYTAINKFVALKDLRDVLNHYPLIGGFSEIVAWGLPITETLIALLLFFPRTKLLGLWSSLILMSTFTIYLIYMLVSTPQLPCTCGGMLQKLTWPQHLAFNIFFVLLALTSIWLYKKQRHLLIDSEPTQIVFT